MQTIKINVNGQSVEKEDEVLMVSKSRNEYKIQFVFSDDWNDVQGKTATFRRAESSKVYTVELASDNTCTVPWEVMETPKIYISVFGGDLRTATEAVYEVAPAGYNEDAEPSGTVPQRTPIPTDLQFANGVLHLIAKEEEIGEGVQLPKIATDLLLTDRLLQLGVGGEAIGEGVQLPQEQLALWNDITLDEDVDSIEITQTDAAAPINLKRAYFIFMGQFSVANPSVRVRANGGQIYQAYSTVTAPADTDCTCWITIDKLAPGIFSSTYITTAITNNAATPSNPILQGLQTAIQPTARDMAFRAMQSADAYLHIRSLLVSLGSGQTIRAGSRILVFGAQDNS